MAKCWLAANACAWSARYARLIKARLEADIFPDVGALDIAAIDSATMLRAFRKIEDRGSIDMAHRVRNCCSEIFRFGIADEKCTHDPTRDIAPAMRRPPAVQHRAAANRRQSSADVLEKIVGHARSREAQFDALVWSRSQDSSRQASLFL